MHNVLTELSNSMFKQSMLGSEAHRCMYEQTGSETILAGLDINT